MSGAYYISHVHRPDRYLCRNGKWESMADYFAPDAIEAAIAKADAPNEKGVWPEKGLTR